MWGEASNGIESRRVSAPYGAAYVEECLARSGPRCSAPGASTAVAALSHGLNTPISCISGCGSRPHNTGRAPDLRSDCPRSVCRGLSAHRDPFATRRRAGIVALADKCGQRLRNLAARVAAVIHVEAIWLATEPLDMRAGADKALPRVITVFGAAQPHHAYCFAKRRVTRRKVLVYDGIGMWLAARRLNYGSFVWASSTSETALALEAEQWHGRYPCWVCLVATWAARSRCCSLSAIRYASNTGAPGVLAHCRT
jgi:transposase